MKAVEVLHIWMENEGTDTHLLEAIAHRLDGWQAKDPPEPVTGPPQQPNWLQLVLQTDHTTLAGGVENVGTQEPHQQLHPDPTTTTRQRALADPSETRVRQGKIHTPQR